MTIKIKNRIKITTPSPKIRWTIFCVLAALALAVRLPQLGSRPMHTDEAVNAYITGQLLAGEKYRYDPQDRHGPVLYLLAKPVAQLGGAKAFSELTETQLRLTPVMVGAGLILLFGAVVEIFGFIPCLIAALLFAFAPLPVYYSRYFIHETPFVAATFGLALSGWQALKKNSLKFAALAGLCAALMLACKETAVIHFFAAGCAGFVGWLANSRKPFPTFKITATVTVVFLITAILLFTWGGQNWSALGSLLTAISRFSARAAGEGHAKSFDYYLSVIGTGSGFVLLAVVGIIAALGHVRKGRRKSSLVLLIYALLTFLIYSAIPYKTPWLALNLWLPLALLCGLGAEAVWFKVTGTTGRSIVAIAFFGLMVMLGHQTKLLVFDRPADEKNPFAYAHTSEDLLRLPGRIEELSRQKNLSSPRIAVVTTDAWPLPWYLRKFFQVGYWQPGQETGAADFFITTTDVRGGLAKQLKSYRPEFFGVRPNMLLILWTPPTTLPPP